MSLSRAFNSGLLFIFLCLFVKQAYSTCSTPPTLIVPPDRTVECIYDRAQGGVSPNITGYAISKTVAACPWCPASTPFYVDKVTSKSATCPYEKKVKRTWTTYACDDTVKKNQVIRIQDTLPPVFDPKCPRKIVVQCGSDISPKHIGVPKVSDGCSPAQSIKLSYKDKRSGSIVQRTWKAIDQCGNYATLTQIIQIKDTKAPAWKAGPTCCSPPTATDNCTPANKLKISYQDYPLTGWQFEKGTIKRVWTATDESGNTSKFEQYLVLDDNKKPVWDTLPKNLTIDCSQSTLPSYCGSPTALDDCSPPHINYTDQIVQGRCSAEKTIKRLWVAEDSVGNKIYYLQYIWVIDKTPPNWTYQPANVTVECDQDYSVKALGTAQAKDKCCSQVDVDYYDVESDGNCTNCKTVNRYWTAKDDCGNTARFVQVIHVVDTKPPVFDTSCLPDISLETGGDSTVKGLGGPLKVTDNCSPADKITLTYKNTRTTDKCGTITILRLWTATDECGNSATFLQKIVIQGTKDTEKPTWTALPSPSIKLTCHNKTDPKFTGTPKAKDNCDPSPKVTYQDSVQHFDNTGCPSGEIIKRTWTATDSSGNFNTFVQNITVVASPPEKPTFKNFCLWPANHYYYKIQNFTKSNIVTAQFTCSGKIVIKKQVTCTSNQPDSDGAGSYVKDCYYDNLSDTLFVRSEISPNSKKARVYSVNLWVADSPNAKCKSVKVVGQITVPVVEKTGCRAPNTTRK